MGTVIVVSDRGKVTVIDLEEEEYSDLLEPEQQSHLAHDVMDALEK